MKIKKKYIDITEKNKEVIIKTNCKLSIKDKDEYIQILIKKT